jgi:RND family efflux transporter MFP subunit
MNSTDDHPKSTRQENSSEEDVIFPMEDSEKEGNRPLESTSKPGRKINIYISIIFFFALGYSFNSPVFKDAKQAIQHLIILTQEKAEPLKQTLTEKLKFKENPNRQIKPKESAKKQPAELSEKTSQKIKYWQAPMNPSYTSDKPGKSPMGMDLVPVYEDESNTGSKIKINPTITQNIGVKTVTAKSKKLKREIRTIGQLSYDERLIHHIHTKYGGWIEKLYVDFTGQKIEKDDLLLDIYSPELVSTQEELVLALKYEESLKDNSFFEISRGAQSLVESTKKRLELFDVPAHQIDELIKTRKVSKTMHIHSPVSGFVVKKNAEHGRLVQPGTNLYMVADLSNIWVLGDIYEYELPWIQIGQQVAMSLSYFPGKTFKGKVTFIDPVVDPKTRTVKVRMEFKNSNWKLKPGMYANIVIQSPVPKKSIVIPEEGVIRSGQKNFAVVQNSDGSFESRDVVLGIQSEGLIQILKGINLGDKVVTSSNFLIDSESKLKEAINKMSRSKTN